MDRDKLTIIFLAIVFIILSFFLSSYMYATDTREAVIGRGIAPTQIRRAPVCKEEVIGRGLYKSC